MMIDDCEVMVRNGELPQDEIARYVAHGRGKYGSKLRGIDIAVDGDYVELSYRCDVMPFQRIRRITGYLVGTLDHFNDAKRAEERDRVKHSVG